MNKILPKNYRFGFILTTLLGNETRYSNFRKYSGTMADVECVWAPIRHFYLPSEPDPVRMLPGPLHTRGVVIAQAAPVLRALRSFDAVMVHQFEALNFLALRSYFAAQPIVIAAQDLPPVLDKANYPLYPEQREKAAWRAALRLATDKWALRRAGHFIGFSEWSAAIVRKCGVNADHVAAIHVGLDLEVWKVPSGEPAKSDRLQILFEAGDFERKGGKRVLDLFVNRLSATCELHIVTRTNLCDLPPNVHVHYGLGTGDPKLVLRFQRADIFILPTSADVSSWVTLEAMAASCAVAVSRIGGIPDLVTADTGMLFDPTSDVEFASVVESLVNDTAQRLKMGKAGRAHVERNFDAARNVPAILTQMKSWVDQTRLIAGVKVPTT